MTHFGVKPPTALMGMLKTANEVTIIVDLAADYRELLAPAAWADRESSGT